jgi:uncharacterized protein YqhQ
MMRGDDLWTVTVRTPDGGLKSQTTLHKAWSRRRKILGLPLLRGPVVLVDSLVVGLKALSFSAEEAAKAEPPKAAPAEASSIKKPPRSEEGPSPSVSGLNPAPGPASDGASASERAPASDQACASDQAPDSLKNFPSSSIEAANQAPDKPALSPWAMAASLIAGVGLAMILFVALPHLLSLLLGKAAGFDERGLFFHLVDGVFKFAILIIYIKAIGLMSEIGRLYAYHGAEHKAIHVYEARLPLTPEAAAPFPAWHPRCGTAFLFLVLALSVLFFAILFPVLFRFESLGRVGAALAGVGVKILLTLPLSALAYELTRLAAKKDQSRFFNAMIWPGLLLQRLTTREPDRGQLEVAIDSLERVLAFGREKGPGAALSPGLEAAGGY